MKLKTLTIREILVFAAFSLAIGYGFNDRYQSCRICGVRRTYETRLYFGVPIWQREILRPTQYSLLHDYAVGTDNHHVWVGHGFSRTQAIGGLLTAGVGCGSPPKILLPASEEELKPLWKKDKGTIRNVLNSYLDGQGFISNRRTAKLSSKISKEN